MAPLIRCLGNMVELIVTHPLFRAGCFAARLTHTCLLICGMLEVVVVKLLLIPAKLRWAHLSDECVILNLISRS